MNKATEDVATKTPNAADVSADLTSSVDTVRTTLQGITDPASARAALPKLQQATERLDRINSLGARNFHRVRARSSRLWSKRRCRRSTGSATGTIEPADCRAGQADNRRAARKAANVGTGLTPRTSGAHRSSRQVVSSAAPTSDDFFGRRATSQQARRLRPALGSQPRRRSRNSLQIRQTEESRFSQTSNIPGRRHRCPAALRNIWHRSGHQRARRVRPHPRRSHARQLTMRHAQTGDKRLAVSLPLIACSR